MAKKNQKVIVYTAISAIVLIGGLACESLPGAT